MPSVRDWMTFCVAHKMLLLKAK